MSGEIIVQDVNNDVLEFIDVTNRGVGCYDEAGNMLIIKETDPNQVSGNEYEIVINKVTGITSGSTNIQYPSAAAVYNIVMINADKNFRYTQNVPSKIWSITHMLGKRPSVTITDSAGTTIEGMISYVDLNNLTVEFSVAFSGYAELN